MVYFVLFGKLSLYLPMTGPPSMNDVGSEMSQGAPKITLGKVNIGWSLGEEILYDKNLQIRRETCIANSESCLLGIMKSKLAIIQKSLLDKDNQKDYFVLESVLKGNYLIKSGWRKEHADSYYGSQKSRSSPGHSQINQEDAGFDESGAAHNVFLT